jgi:diguanylate cyclase (GGDEF)-like protein
MALRWTMAVFGSIVLAAALMLLATGTAAPLLVQLPWMAPVLWSLFTAAMAATAAVCGFLPPIKAGPFVSATLSILALAAMISDAVPQPGNALDGRYLALFCVVAVAAGSGSLAGWITAVFVIIAGLIGNQIAQLVATTAFTAGDSTLPLIIGTLKATGPISAALTATGILTWIAARRGRPTSTAREVPGHQAPPARKPPESGTVTAAPPPHPPTSVLIKTSSFTVDTVSELTSADDTGLKDLLSSIVYFMGRNFKAYSGLGFIFDPARQAFLLNSYTTRSSAVIAGATIPAGQGIVGEIATQKHSFMSGDVSMYNKQLLYYQGTEVINSVIAVPIISESKELLGALVIDSKDRNAFNDQHKETLSRFSGLAAALITNARMRLFQERAARQFQIFYEASQRFTTTLKTLEVFDALMAMVSQLTYTTRIMTIVFNPARRTGVIHKIAGFAAELREGLEFPINTGLYSFAFQKRTVVSIPDLRQFQGRYYRFMPEEPANPAICSLVVLPIIDDESRCLGLLSLESDRPGQFGGDIEQILSTLVGNASVAFNRALLYQRMETLATTDGLTGLNNHRTFQEVLSRELDRAKRYNQIVSILLLDIDHFKSFNDTYGHPVGDLVLKEIAASLLGSTRKTDTVARYGGEEFTVIMPMTDQQNGLILAGRIRQAIEAREIVSMERRLRVTVSVGCATFPHHAKTQQELIDNADKAMYYSKEHGRNQVTLFAAGMEKEKKV